MKTKMAIPVAGPFGGHASIKSRLEVGTRLVREAEGDEENVGELLAQVFGLVAFFLGLFPIAAGDDAGHFAHFFGELSHVGQFIEVANTKVLNPLIDFGLEGLNGCSHVILCFWSPW